MIVRSILTRVGLSAATFAVINLLFLNTPLWRAFVISLAFGIVMAIVDPVLYKFKGKHLEEEVKKMKNLKAGPSS